ncbi:hypothetical protein MFIFM68171_03208 [Madurella fahalii]|uniref:Uncharacterized protein n=1 Tax=Madurella fahalii TaxID=1157608 RepID=A0ABQ0G5F6_9PEZI
MKFAAATMALGLAPLALGKSVQNVYPGRRDGHHQGVAVGGISSIPATDAHLAELQRLLGLHPGSGVSINFLWVNVGGGAATTVLGQASTVTVTQTVVGGVATAPPAVVTESGTPVVAPPATSVVVGGATHSVTVGGPQGLAFSPQQLEATVGDTVIFTFLSQNHTATQSAFDTPCQPLEGGMDSGFQANPNNTINPPPQVAMQVMVDTPLWFYCRQGPHCGKGMVFSINPTADKTHAMFQSMAIQQAGNGAGGAITGNGPNPDASASLPVPPASTDAAGAVNTGIATGVGQVGADGSCVCAVQCSFGGFPNVAVQGRDSFGGFGGSVPMAMVGAQQPPAKKFRA